MKFSFNKININTNINNTIIYNTFVFSIILFRFLLTADLGVHTIYSSHDDMLYILRAYHLLVDGTIGVYDARTFVKLPGFSFFLAALRLFGLPYLQTIFILQALSGLYLLHIFERSNIPKIFLLISFFLYMLNPVSFDAQSFRIMREPIALILQVTILGSMCFIYYYSKFGKLSWLHLFILSVACSSLLLIREEDIILLGVLLVFLISLFINIRNMFGAAKSVKITATILFVALLTIFTGNIAARLYIYKIYGSPILHDFGEGEFPKLIAALRSIDTKKDNRLVMPSQEVLLKLREQIPETIPLISKLPRPGSGADSCARFGVCSEWTSGYMYFWLKDSAFATGSTPDLPTSQLYFMHLRHLIEKGCSDGRLQCNPKGNGMFPPFELRWTRAMLYEVSKSLNMMLRPPFTDPVYPQDSPVDDQTMKMYKFVTMSPYVSPLQSVTGVASQTSSQDYKSMNLFNNVKYDIVNFYNIFGTFIMIAGFISFIFLVWNWYIISNYDIIVFAALMATIYSCFRLFALSYLSIYMGTLEPRLFFSTYVIAMFFSVPLIFSAVKIFQNIKN